MSVDAALGLAVEPVVAGLLLALGLLAGLVTLAIPRVASRDHATA